MTNDKPKKSKDDTNLSVGIANYNPEGITRARNRKPPKED